jgi:hypothetical protein
MLKRLLYRQRAVAIVNLTIYVLHAALHVAWCALAFVAHLSSQDLGTVRSITAAVLACPSVQLHHRAATWSAGDLHEHAEAALPLSGWGDGQTAWAQAAP